MWTTKLPLYPGHKAPFNVFEFRARLTSLLSRSVMNSQLSSNYANRRWLSRICWWTWKTLPLDGNYFTLFFGEDRSKQVQENVFKVQDREVALQHKHNAENATIEMEQLSPIPPKAMMKVRRNKKRAILASLKWGEWWSRCSIYFVQDCRLRALLKPVINKFLPPSRLLPAD